MIKLKQPSNWKTLSVIGMLALSLPTLSFAQIEDDNTDISGLSGLTQVLNQIKADIETFATQYGLMPPNKEISNKTPDLTEMKNGNSSAFAAADFLQLAIVPLSLNTIQGMINQAQGTYSKGNAGTTLGNLYGYTNEMGLSDPLPAGLTQPNLGQGELSKTVPPNKNDNALSFDHFFTTQAYAPAQDGASSAQSRFPNDTPLAQAGNFIKFITSEVVPLGVYSPTQLIQKWGTKHPERIALYLTQLRQYAAYTSIALSNFNQMLAYRTQLPANQTKAEGITDINGNAIENPSLAQIDHYRATRRLRPAPTPNTKSWHDQMENATSMVLQRETLYLLAEMNQQLAQLRQQQERLLATNSALLQSTSDANLRSSVDPSLAEPQQSQ